MNKTLQISTSLDQPALLENMVEQLAYRRYDTGYGNETMPTGHKALETSSTETYLSGTLLIDEDAENIQMPFITSFLFTCIKGKNDPYKIAWVTSLS